MTSLTDSQTTSLQNAKDDLISAVATYAAGEPFVHSYTILGRTKIVKSLDEIFKAIAIIDRLLDSSTSGTPANMVSYGSYKRYS